MLTININIWTCVYVLLLLVSFIRLIVLYIKSKEEKNKYDYFGGIDSHLEMVLWWVGIILTTILYIFLK